MDGISIDSCAIITTDCNALMQPIHDRMPVIVEKKEDWNTWLAPDVMSEKVLWPMLKPFAPDLMQLWPVSPAVGKVVNQGENLIRPVKLLGGNNSS